MARTGKAGDGPSMKSIRPTKTKLERTVVPFAKSDKKKGSVWPLEEDVLLVRAKEHDNLPWPKILELFPARGNGPELRYN
jgi:hypothetical protein